MFYIFIKTRYFKSSTWFLLFYRLQCNSRYVCTAWVPKSGVVANDF